MTPGQYRREGFQAGIEAAALAAEDRTPSKHGGALAAHVAGMAIQKAIRAIDVDEVMAKSWSVTCNGCGWMGDEEGLIGTLDADDGEPCRACPTCGTDGNLMDTHPAAPDLHVTTPDAVARLVEAAEFFGRRRERIEDDVSSGHSGRGPGASSWMREDDRDFLLDLRNAFDALSIALAACKGARDE